jgi:hypothetical protein|tara:strand:+ start:2552 stop:3211 length:660 start_codon:yes stop_codon:yes gene_type:complete
MVQNLSKKNKSHSKDIAFVLGNGLSRRSIQCEKLVNVGTVYGCNAQYREFDPHYIVAVDVKMVNEMIEAGYHNKGTVWTNPNKGIKTNHGVNFFSPHKGWSSGPTALWFAASNGHKKIYIAGFDYQGVKGKFNNVYADTFNYKKTTDSATFFGNWLSQTEKVIQEFTHTTFYRIIDDGAFIPDKLGPQYTNLKHISITDFGNTFEGIIYPHKMNQNTTI